jgi:hypothetical protein
MPHDLKVQDSPNCLEVLKYGILGRLQKNLFYFLIIA